MIIAIPYTDKDEDGIVDGKNIDELTLNACWYDEKNEEWKVLSDVLVFPKENMVTAKTNHFTTFGIAGAEKKNEDTFPSENIGQNNSGSGDDSCFIATAAFGSPMAEEVIILREFRDKYLLKTESGRKFIDFYYHFSPPIAEFIKNKPLIKAFARYCIKLLVSLTQSVL
jgi:hypothetical protein